MVKEVAGIKLFTVEEVADKYPITIRTVREYIRTDKLQASKAGASYLISEDALRAFFGCIEGEGLGELQTAEEVADALGLRRRVVVDYCTTGKLRGGKMGTEWFIPKSSLQWYFHAKSNPGLPGREGLPGSRTKAERIKELQTVIRTVQLKVEALEGVTAEDAAELAPLFDKLELLGEVIEVQQDWPRINPFNDGNTGG